MKKGITLKDIAKKLNMSVSTVSKALNNDATISILTRERVHEVADRMNYVPNEAARNFKQNKTHTIAVILPSLLDQFFVLAINGMEEAANSQQYNVIFAQTQEDTEREHQILKLMIRNRVDGIIIAVTKNTVDMKLFDNLKQMGIPVVFFTRIPSDAAYDFVASSNEQASFDATEYLIKRGHTRIAHLSGPKAMQTSRERYAGYQQALEKHNIPADPALVKEVDFSKASHYRAMEELVNLQNPPGAVLAFKTYIALDAIEYLKKMQPDKLDRIEFAGFGNFPLLEHLDHKPVVTIEENAVEMGRAAANLLLTRIIEADSESEPRPVQHLHIGYNLVEQ